MIFNTPNNTLVVLPTFRAVRELQANQPDGFLPKFATLEEFFKSVKFINGYKKASNIVRKLLLKKAATGIFGAAELGFESEFLRFLKTSDFLFRFFDELFAEEVEFNALILSDTYAKFDDHLNVLKTVWNRYTSLLTEYKLYDNSYPVEFDFNRSYLDSFESVEVFFGGYATRRELSILKKLTKYKDVVLYVTVTSNNKRMFTRLKELGFDIYQYGSYKLCLNDKTFSLLENEKITQNINSYSLKTRLDQAILVQDLISDLVTNGIDAQKIAVVTPDEDFAKMLKLVDEKRNLNFAMGIKDEALYNKLLAIADNKCELLSLQKPQNIEELFALLNEQAYEEPIAKAKDALLFDASLTIKDVAHIILSELESIDDVGGGKITVMGLLETRNVSFDGLIIVDFDLATVPKPSTKDLFLTSDIKKRAGLPTKQDRDALQAFYYEQAINKSKNIFVLHSGEESHFFKLLNLPSPKKFGEISIKKYIKQQNIKETPINLLALKLKTVEWSHTKLETFFICKRRFYFKYIMNIKDNDPLAKKSVALELGEKFHAILYKNPDMNKKEIIKNLLLEPSSEAFKIECRKLFFALDSFCKTNVNFRNAGFKTIYKEDSFAANIAGYKFTAKIDRVDYDGDKYNIIDYKLGKNIKIQNPKEELDRTNFQLAIYALALKEKVAKDKSLEKYLLDTNAFLWAISEEKLVYETDLFNSIDILNKKLLLLPEEETEFIKCDKISSCHFCNYKIMCGIEL